ncbi:MAG: STAS domain-containing protein, partial [Spirochaetota bacterium]
MGLVEIKSNADKCMVSFKGKATIEHASEIKDKLLQVIKKYRSIELDLHNISNADISFLQLLE